MVFPRCAPLPSSNLVLAHTCKGGEHGYCMKTRSRLVANGSSQVAGIGYIENTPPTPAVAPVKMIAAVANEKYLPAYYLDVSEAFTQPALQEEILPPGCVELSGKVVRLLKSQYGLK